MLYFILPKHYFAIFQIQTLGTGEKTKAKRQAAFHWSAKLPLSHIAFL